MTNTSSQSHRTSYFFIILLITGAVMFIGSFFTENQSVFLSGLQQIALGILAIGIGEWMNHPLQKSMAIKDETHKEKKDFIFQKIQHRRRSPSSLGNLLDICGLILIFIGLSDFV